MGLKMSETLVSNSGSAGPVADAASNELQLAWWCKSTDLRLASVRLRAALLMRMLSQRGIATVWFSKKDVSRYRCVVVRKRYDDDTVRQLRRFKQNGGRLVLDLCDNDFLPASQRHKHLHKVENLRALVAMADTVVASAEPLAQIVVRECSPAGRVVVIGDVPDDLSIIERSLWRRYWSNWRSNREFARLENVAAAGVARLIWFGACGGKRQLSGMADLARIAPMLANLSQQYPLHLTVISNSVKLYRKCVSPVLPSSRYIEWNSATFDSLLRQQHIVLIPAQHNEYTACKSDNRVVTALRAGLAVVAEPVPSYAAYKNVIMLGDMEAGLRQYLSDPARRIADARRGPDCVATAVNAQRLLALWLDVCGLQEKVFSGSQLIAHA